MTPTLAVLERMRSRSVDAALLWVIRSLKRGLPVVDARRRREALEVGVDHHLDEAGEIHRRGPPEHVARLRAVANQMLDFRRTYQVRIEPHVLLPVEPRVAKRDLDQIAH